MVKMLAALAGLLQEPSAAETPREFAQNNHERSTCNIYNQVRKEEFPASSPAVQLLRKLENKQRVFGS
jgi:hypothetical protein